LINTAGTNGGAFFTNLKVTKKKDVVVIGSGPAGCAAALSASRNGADTLLIERQSFLGGLMTGGGIGGIGINGYRSETEGRPIVVKGISLEIFRRLQAAGGAPPGEAAGAAAALSIRLRTTPRNLDVMALQKALLAQGVLLSL